MDDSPLESARRWLAVLAAKDYAAWPAMVADDVVMRFPFAPPGIPGECHGRMHCAAVIEAFFAGIEQFTWHDVEAYAAVDPGLVFMTARSEAKLKNGRDYANEYCFMLRFRGGLLSDYREYFNPLPAIAAFT